jgi:hypothetical protein
MILVMWSHECNQYVLPEGLHLVATCLQVVSIDHWPGKITAAQVQVRCALRSLTAAELHAAQLAH